MNIYHFIIFDFFQDKISLCSLGCPWNSLSRPDWLQIYRDLPASVFLELRLKACVTITWHFQLLHMARSRIARCSNFLTSQVFYNVYTIKQFYQQCMRTEILHQPYHYLFPASSFSLFPVSACQGSTLSVSYYLEFWVQCAPTDSIPFF